MPERGDDLEASVTIEFDANVRGPWDFKPAQRSVVVHPGQMTTVEYEFTNVQNRTMSAQAIPSYAPMQAGPFFNKIECFCFTEQRLEPGQSVDMPVTFFVDPAMAQDTDGAQIRNITLSYTFYRVENPKKVEPTRGAAVPAASSGKGS